MALFGGAKPDHPMADIRQARKLITELPVNDAAKALEEVTFWLHSSSHTEGFRPEFRYELFDLLDRTAKNFHRKLAQEYLASDRQEKFREHKLWTTVFEFWKMLGEAYCVCIEEAQTPAGSVIRKELPAIIARVMRGLTLQLKWVMYRYGPIDERVWGELGRLYALAESRGIANTPTTVYPGAHGQSTVQLEFLKSLMLGVSSADGLTPIKQEIAERTIAHFSHLFVLLPEPEPGCNYFFDLAQGKPAARVLKGVNHTATTRYFGAGKALPALQELMQVSRDKNGVPSDVNLGGIYPTDLTLSVMGHLKLHWADKPPARGSERHKIATRLTVVHGFDLMLKSVAPIGEQESLDFQAHDGYESWVVENVSEGGFGAIIPPVKGDKIRVGSLLCVQPETAQFWSAGIVRRLTRDDLQQRRVGIQLLSKAVILVKLAPAGNESSFDATRNAHQAVLLSSTPDRDGEIALLLKVGSFTPGESLEMKVRSKQYYLMPSKLVEGGEDFDCAKFKVMHRE